MIKVRLQGGLGNQMFEYAVGRSLSLKRATNLKLVFDQPREAFTPRNYQLDCFQLTPDIRVEIRNRGTGNISKVLRKLTEAREQRIMEESYAYDPKIMKLPDGVYLDGYFQTEKYFKWCESEIRSDFAFKNKLTGKNAEVADRMTKNNSVSLHIRRGDYVKDKTTNAFHGIPSLDYYAKGVEYITKKFGEVHGFVFSDDIDWVKENLKLPRLTFVDWNKAPNDYIDMQLMSLCKHNVIANSSFSWWGAWLNKNPEKIVIAPKQWFADISINTMDLIPESWNKI